MPRFILIGRHFRGRKGAFTLTELLVALVILTTIMGLLISALVKTRDSARQAKCVANLKQIGVAITAYANDNGQRTPEPPSNDPYVGKDFVYIYNNVMWGKLFDGGYLSRDKSGAKCVFCPAIPPSSPGGVNYQSYDIPAMIEQNDYKGGYRMVGYIMRNNGADGNSDERGKGVSLNQADGTWRRAIVSDYYVHENAYSNYPAAMPSSPYHGFGWNVLYLDGSVKMVKRDVLPENTSLLNYGTYFKAFDAE